MHALDVAELVWDTRGFAIGPTLPDLSFISCFLASDKSLTP